MESADVLAFEANLDATPDLRIARYNSGTSLSKNISEALFADTQKLWTELRLDEDELERLRPWWVAFCLMNALMPLHGFHHRDGIDRRVLNMGKKRGKNLFFLESINAGLAPFDRAPQQEQELFLSRVAQHTDEGLQELASIVAAWGSRNPENLLPVVEKCLRLLPKMYTSALAGRNKAWLSQLLRLSRTGKNTVAVVGALHMVGPGSIPVVLDNAGCRCSYVGE